uniref:Uncharacterized protein n=1 Tax=Arundo donax TaxID=35708 RepID=A0A0A9GMM2_ARUDO
MSKKFLWLVILGRYKYSYMTFFHFYFSSSALPKSNILLIFTISDNFRYT